MTGSSIQLKLDLEKHNAQYPEIDIKILAESHDRFMVIDNKELYHIGASLKDLGKKGLPSLEWIHLLMMFLLS